MSTFELEGTPWDIGKPSLIGLTHTEWWMLFTQIKSEVCFVTDSGYNDDINLMTCDNFMTRFWTGTVITPGADMYRIEAVDKTGQHVFTRIEKISL